VPGVFVAARILFKRNATDLDADALIDHTVTTTLSAAGQITLDGAAGPYAVFFNLTDADTALLTPLTNFTKFYGFYEVRLTTAAGQEYTPVREARVIALPRLIIAV
jgi:hypothetical protein